MINIKEYILENIERIPIVEMAIGRSKFCDTCVDLYDQICQNWCLIKYCNLHDPENDCRLHWCKELLSALGKIDRYNVEFSKGRALRQAWINLYQEPADYVIIDKFEEEGVKTDCKVLEQLFIKEGLPKIIELLSKRNNFTNIRNYIYNNI